MLKIKIIKTLEAAFPDIQDSRQFEHAADVLIELLIRDGVMATAIGAAIAAYEEGVESPSAIS